MQGLRTQESPEFRRYFEVVQRHAAKAGCVFFVDAGEGRDVSFEDLEGEDLSGWLVPCEHAYAFQDEWDSTKPNDQWLPYFCFAIWRVRDGQLVIDFKEFR